MNSLPYYKAYPRDFLEGAAGMSLEIKGAYRILLDVIYLHAGRAPDDVHYLSGQLGCSVRKWKSIRETLLAAGKIWAFDGIISNLRADKELEITRKYRDKNAENGSKSRKNNKLVQATAAVRARVLKPEPDTDNISNPPVSPLGRGEPDPMEDRPDEHTRPNAEGHHPEAGAEAKAEIRTGSGGGVVASGGADTPAPRRKSARKQQFTPDWWPSPAGEQFATEHGCPDLAANVAACLDHHISRGNAFADRDRAWQTWCRNAGKFGWAVAANVSSGGHYRGGQAATERSAYAARLLTASLDILDEWSPPELSTSPYDA